MKCSEFASLRALENDGAVNVSEEKCSEVNGSEKCSPAGLMQWSVSECK